MVKKYIYNVNTEIKRSIYWLTIMFLSKIKNLPYKLRRELYKVPQLYAIKEQAHQKAVDYHAPFLPLLDNQGKLIVDTLRRQGTCVIPLSELELSATEQMMTRAFTMADKLKTFSKIDRAKIDQGKKSEISPAQEDFGEFPEFLLWGLESKLLDIIENYIQLPILYQGYAVRRSIADGKYSGVRRWHIDWEDRCVIKVIIYLNDVAAGGGAYEYIDRDKTLEAIQALNYYNLGYLSAAEMKEAVSPIDWTTCLAKQGTVIISDTSSVFHRAQPPTNIDRYSITFCYTSANPLVIWPNPPVARQEWEEIDRQLNHRQRNCLTNRKFSS
jgi:hypothetical protein